MKIAEMIKRESFESILINTVNEFYPERIFSFYNGSGSTFYMHPTLNTISVSKCKSAIRNYIKREFTYNNILKNTMAQIYVNAAFNMPELISQKAFSWSPSRDYDDSMLIFPSNRKIRFMDFCSGNSRVCMKHGYNNMMIQKEIEFRKKYENQPFILKILESDERYYTESILSGQSVIRIADRDKRNRYREMAVNMLDRFGNESKNNEDIKVYAESLNEHIEKSLSDVRYKELKILCSDVCNAVEPGIIEKRLSHGDLQEGNMWVDDRENIYILDWESCEIRSSLYDDAVFYYNTRNAYDYVNALTRITENIYNINSIGRAGKNSVRIFILEDIKWMIDEMSVMNGYEPIGLNVLKQKHIQESIRRII